MKYFTKLLILFSVSNFSLYAQWEKVPGAGSKKEEFFNILNISIGNKKNIWARTTGSKLFTWDGTKWAIPPKVPVPHIIGVTATKDNSIYALGRHKYDENKKVIQPLYYCDGKYWLEAFVFNKIATSITGIAENNVVAILEGKPFQWNGTTLTQLGKLGNFVNVAAGPDGTIWGVIKMPGDPVKTKIMKWDGKTWTKIIEYEKVETPIVPEKLAIGDKNNVWMVHDLDIYKWNNTTKKFDVKNGKHSFVALAVGAGGPIWALNEKDGEIYQWNEDTKSPEVAKPASPKPSTKVVTETPLDNAKESKKIDTTKKSGPENEKVSDK